MKTIDEIYGEMLAVFSGETGLSAQGGGDLAVRFYAVAAQVYALYTQADWVKRQCFPQLAQGEHLDLHAQMRGLERRPATAAEGVLRFETDEPAATDRLVEVGVVCMTAGLVRFETLEAVTLTAGQSWVEARARALESGTSGNVAAGSVRGMAVAPVGIGRCTNRLPFMGGVDREDDEGLRARILDSYHRLPNGANAAYYEQEAMTFDQVVKAVVLPRVRGTGTVDVVVATKAGLPSEALLQDITDHLAQRREIAVDVKVRAPSRANTNAHVKVKVRPGYDGVAVRAEVEAKIRDYFDGRRLGVGIINGEIANLIFRTEGVENYLITAPSSDVVMGKDCLLMLNEISVGELT